MDQTEIAVERNEIEKFARLLSANNSCIELRAIGGEYSKLGYFNNIKAFVDAAASQHGMRNVYLTLNPVKIERLGIAPNNLIDGYPGAGSGDEDVIYRRQFLIDLDYDREKKNTNASESELQETRKVFEQIVDDLRKRGIEPTLVFSGNGYHITTPLPNYPNDGLHREKHKLLLKWFHRQYSVGSVHVDTSVFNAARIIRCPGTLNIKGPHMVERPQRLAHIISTPNDPIQPVDLFQTFEKETAEQKAIETQRASSKRFNLKGVRGDLKTLDIVSLFEESGMYYSPLRGSGDKHVVNCPWSEMHTVGKDGDSSTVIWESDGESWPTFHCSHSHCQNRKLREVLEYFGIDKANEHCTEEYTPKNNNEEEIKLWLASNNRDARKIQKALSSLDSLSYEMYRQPVADKAKIRVNQLDKEVRQNTSSSDEKGIISLEEINPWTDAVDGPQVFKEVERSILKYVVMPDYSAIATALWIFFSHAVNKNVFDINPRLFITGPEKRCGKSTLLSIVGALVPKKLAASNASPSSIFRAIDNWHPTLLIDEVDSFAKQNDELRGILNSGHTPGQAYILRNEKNNKDNHVPKLYSTWTPMVMAGIGRVWSTLEDRSIIIELQRKTTTEPVKRLLYSQVDNELNPLQRKAARWIQDNLELIKGADPEIPGTLNDRAADNWRPLFAIADALGIGNEARKSSVQLSANQEEDDSFKIRLLGDLKPLFEKKDSWPSSELIKALVEIEESPWGDFRAGKPINAQKLAALLKPFKIRTKQLWIDGNNKRGYEYSQFKGVFARYLTTRDARTLESTQPIKNNSDFNYFKTLEFQNPVTPTSTVTACDKDVYVDASTLASSAEDTQQMCVAEKARLPNPQGFEDYEDHEEFYEPDFS